jgi:hypothetical protein
LLFLEEFQQRREIVQPFLARLLPFLQWMGP